jgi:mRNA export factor
MFKCHRHEKDVYAVNAIAFNPMGTFATCGSDGQYVFWDKDSKQRLKAFERKKAPISASAFNKLGNMFAYAVSYDWSKGAAQYTDKTNQIYLHSVQAAEVRPRGK